MGRPFPGSNPDRFASLWDMGIHMDTSGDIHVSPSSNVGRVDRTKSNTRGLKLAMRSVAKNQAKYKREKVIFYRRMGLTAKYRRFLAVGKRAPDCRYTATVLHYYWVLWHLMLQEIEARWKLAPRRILSRRTPR